MKADGDYKKTIKHTVCISKYNALSARTTANGGNNEVPSDSATWTVAL